MTNKELKNKIKEDLGFKLMVRNYTPERNTISVWLYPKDRTKENDTILKEYLVKLGYMRCVKYSGWGRVFSGNLGEFNALRLRK